MVTEIAYAKINLFLDVTGIREDRFHNIKSVMHTISLSDKLTIEALPSDEACIEVSHNSAELKNDKDNLVYKSALKYLTKYDIKTKIFITLEKNIPIGAGLGGGSADAAATLRGLNRIFNRATKDDLLEMAGEIGSDVPLCLVGGIALCEGRGEIITPLDYAPDFNLVVAIGESRVSTPEAYKALDMKFDFCFDDRDKYDFDKTFYNIFEEVVNSQEITKIKECMIKNGAENAMMSGSGPSVFGVFKKEKEAMVAMEELRRLGFSAYYATSKSIG